jgi:hypothetical protein
LNGDGVDMLQNYQITFVVGILGGIISFILLIIGIIKKKKILKMAFSFILIFFIGINSGYYYQRLKNVTNEISDNKTATKAISGSSDDPVVIKEETFYNDDNYYYSEFEIKNNTKIEISKISFHAIYTYESKSGTSTHDEHIFLLDSVIPPNKSVEKNYIWKRDSGEKGLSISKLKLDEIQNLICYVNINGEEKAMKLEDLKLELKNIK